MLLLLFINIAGPGSYVMSYIGNFFQSEDWYVLSFWAEMKYSMFGCLELRYPRGNHGRSRKLNETIAHIG